MCIVLATTAHPSYALIVIDNRDEYVLRPTTRPHWWTAGEQEILSARDLQRKEQGTWMGITRSGKFAALTNYRESDALDGESPVKSEKSRGAMVTAWLSASKEENIEQFVERFTKDQELKGAGGFSLLCGKLMKQGEDLEPLAILSNRSKSPDDVPRIAGHRGEVYGLSNTSYEDPVAWPKVETGKEKMTALIREAVSQSWEEEELVKRLYDLLDTDSLPEQGEQTFEEFVYQLRKSIFVRPIGSPEAPQDLPKADEIAAAETIKTPPTTNGHAHGSMTNGHEKQTNGDQTGNVESGLYGTQRQTIMFVDWKGRVTFIERALWDEKGNPIERGKGDMRIHFQIEGWSD